MRFSVLAPLALASVLFSAGALAEPLNYNQIQLGADARREINNDTLNAVLFTEDSHASPARLSAVLNKRMAAALKIASQHGKVKASSGQLSTWPVYDNNQRVTGWRGRAELRLESRDIEQASQLIGQLQNQLQIAQVGFSVSDEARRKVESELIPQAIGAFRDKARLIVQALGGRDYRLVEMRVDQAGQPGLQVFRAQRAMKAGAPMMAAEAAPSFAPGVSEISVQVQGTVQTAP